MTTIISSIWNRLWGKGKEDLSQNRAKGLDILPLFQSEELSDSVNYKNLGDNALDLDKLNEAAEFYQKAISLNLQYTEAYSNLGLVFREQGKIEAAVSCLNKAISLNPQLANAHYILGTISQGQNDLDNAILSLTKAVELNPDFDRVYNELCPLLIQCERIDEAKELLSKKISSAPHLAWPHLFLGNIYKAEKQNSKAINCYQTALSIQPNSSVAHYNIATTFREESRWAEAASHYKFACNDPNLSNAIWDFSIFSLLHGDYTTGFKLYESRLGVNANQDFFSSQRSILIEFQDKPRWQGEPLHGKTLLVWAEQGCGDFIMMMRYLPKLIELGVDNYKVACGPNLGRLAQGIPSAKEVFTQPISTEEFDFHCSIMSMPFLFGTTVETIPSSVPYIQTNNELTAKWTERLSQLSGIKVGLVWAGGKITTYDAIRSVSLRAFSPLISIPGVTLISLQKGEPEQQLIELNWPILDWMDECIDMADTASLISHLDLVISVDTAVAHLAGAMGKPIWLLNRLNNSDWRWFLEREDSPWYPSMRIFRQQSMHDWNGVINDVANALVSFIHSKNCNT